MSTAVVEETGEIVETMSEAEAREVTERIRFTAKNYVEVRQKLMEAVATAKAGNAHLALGYQSWTNYLSDVMGEEPLRLARDERREVVLMLTEEGMSKSAISGVLDAAPSTIAADRSQGVRDRTPSPREVYGSDGKIYTYTPAPDPTPPAPRKRRPLKDHVRDAAMDLDDALEKLLRLTKDDRFAQNREALRNRIRINQPQLWDQKIQRICDAYGLNRLAELREATQEW